MILLEKKRFYTAKNDKVFKAVMCDEEDDRMILNTEKKISFEEGIEQGITKGTLTTKLETARKMEEEGLSLELISKITSLTEEEIEKL